ncbi:unnamed protein product [Caenorhabditis nigoni]
MSIRGHYSPSSLLTKTALNQAVVRYIPKELSKYIENQSVGFDEVKDGGKEELEWMLANSDNMLRMYGSAEELAADLEIYMKFSNDRWMEYDPIEPYNSATIDSQSVNGERFMQKSNSFIILHHYLYMNVNAVKYPAIYHAILAILLKSIDAQNARQLEYVKVTDVKKLRQKLDDELCDKRIFEKEPQLCPDFDYYLALSKFDAFSEIIEDFKRLIPIWKDEYSRLEDLIEDFLEDNWPNNLKALNFVFNRSKFIVTYVEGIIASYPDLFLPYDRVKNPNHPIIVRMLQDNDEQFVMKSELFNAISLVNPNSKKYEDTNGKLLTMKLGSIFTVLGDLIERIELILVTIQRTKHAAVPVQTPFGDHCILAADALFEILNRLIFCHRIFQKFQESTWPILSTHLAQLSEFFTAHERSPFFVTMEKVELIEEAVTNSLKNYEKIPANAVRNAKKDGFTVQNLKNELANLGVTSLFPEIQEYAEAVYSEVFKSKKQEFLRTCDLFDSVEKCILICFFKRSPNLQLFLHTQNACHRLPSLHCNYCSAVPQRNKFKETTWEDFSYDGDSYRYLSDIEKIILPDGQNTAVGSNFFQTGHETHPEFRCFLLDWDDNNALCSTEAAPEVVEKSARNLGNFQKFYPKKKIYIRAIPTRKERRDETRRVFAEEVLDLIPVVLRQQHTPLKKNDERLNNYRNNWKMPKHSVKTISLTEFWYLLEEFDVDKTRITIVPEPIYENTVYQLMTDFANGFFKIRSYHGKWVVRKEHAAFKIFESVICQLDRSTEQHPEHLNYLSRMRQDVITSILQFLEHNEGAYIDLRKVEITISIFQNHYLFKHYSSEYSPLKSFQLMEVDGFVPIDEFFVYMCNRKFYSYLRENKEMMRETESVSVWKCFEWFLNACLQEFKGQEEENLDIVKVIQEEISFRIPTDENYLEAMKPKEWTMESVPSCEKEQNTGDDVNRKKKKKKTSKMKAEAKPAPESADETEKTLVPEEGVPEVDINQSNNCLGTSELCDEVVSDEASEQSASASEDIQDTSPLKKVPTVDINQSKCCTKCLRTSEMCNEAKKELKMTQNRLEKYEKKAKRTEEVEIQMREMEAEIKRMKKEMKEREFEVKKKDTENEDLKNNVLKLEAKNAKMQLAEKNHSISQNDLLEKITKLSNQLKTEKDRNEMIHSERIDELTAQLEDRNEKIQLMKIQLQKSEENLRLEVREKERGFEELRAVLSIMSNDMESLQRDNRNLRDQIQSTSEAPPAPPVPESPSEGQPNHHRFALFRFQRIKGAQTRKSTGLSRGEIMQSDGKSRDCDPMRTT